MPKEELIFNLDSNSLPNDKFLDWSKLKAFADDKKCDTKIEIRIGKGKNIVGKGENAGHQHFLLFSYCFQKAVFRVVKSWDFVRSKVLNDPENLIGSLRALSSGYVFFNSG